MKTMQVLSLATLAILVTGCSSAAAGEVDGPLLTSEGGSEEGMAAEVTGEVTYDGECVRLGGLPVVWPEGTTWTETEGLTLPGGEQVAEGQGVYGGGGYLSVESVREAFGEAVASAAEDCLEHGSEVAVFNPGSDVTVTSAE